MWTDLLPSLLLLQMIAVQLPQTIAVEVHLPPMPKSAQFTQIICSEDDRSNKIELFDGDGKPLRTVTEFCGSGCSFGGTSNITLGPYTVIHPDVIFGHCTYKESRMEITATDGSYTAIEQLFATCKSGPIVCNGDSRNATIGEINEVIMRESPNFNLATIGLREYSKDGCPADQNFSNQISNQPDCNPITNTGITNVVVVPKPDMLSTCVLTLYADTNCFSPSNAKIGPITPSSNPSACIGPIRNSTGDVFEAKSATLRC